MGRISMPQGKGSQLHNRRDYEKIGREIPENIDPTKSHENITLIDKDIREAYEEIFGNSLKEYNAKQKRSDRKIDDYYEHIAKSKNGEKLFYEDVLQWGKMGDFQNPETREIAKECLLEYAKTFEERNPNLKLIGAYIHMDEASPHLHLDYVPVAHGYKRGLETRNSLDKAMKEMGYVPEKESRKNNATKLWKEHERAVFGEICQEHGLIVEQERQSRGSLSVEEYKEARDSMMFDISKEKEELGKEIQSQRQELATNGEALDQQAKELRRVDMLTRMVAEKEPDSVQLEDLTIPEKKSIFGRVEAPEKQGVFIQNMEKKEIQALMQRAKADEGMERVFVAVENRCNDMVSKAKAEAREIRAEATADRNETIAKAQEIVRQQNSIIQKAKEWAERLKAKYKELADKIIALSNKKERLEQEVARIESYKGELEPLRKEVAELTRAKEIMSGELDYELTRAKFRDWSTMPFNANYDTYRARGELLALYQDGTVRQVGYNSNGGWDDKTLQDERDGLCKVGIMQEEERVAVPKSLLKELMQNRDRQKPITKGLANLIKQQTEVEKTVSRHRGHER